MIRKIFLFFAICLCLFGLTSCKKSVEIIFDSQGGSFVASINDKDDFDVNNLPVPTKEGHTFLGWFLDLNYETNIVGNVPDKLKFTLYAKWEVNSYTIYFNTNGGTAISEQTHVYGSTISAPIPPTKEGNDFFGWYLDEELSQAFEFTTMPAGDLNLYAKWEVQSFTITFDSKGGSVVNPITAAYGSPITEPNQPEKVGYNFLGWFLDEEYTTLFEFTTMPLNGAKVYAKWEKLSYKLIFHSNGGTYIPESIHLFGDAITEPNAPVKEGFDFDGWYTDANLTNKFTFSTMPAQDIHLYAKWTPITYTITFDSQGGSLVEPISTGYGMSIQLPTPEKEGFVFVGWFLDEGFTQSFTSATMPLGGAHLYAKWALEPNTITFVTGFEDLAVDPITAYPGEEINLPAPQYVGYDFAGWFLDENHATKFEDALMPEESITLYAKWEPKWVAYTVLHYAEHPEIEGLFEVVRSDNKYDYTGTVVEASLLPNTYAEITDHPNRVFSGTVKGDGSLVLSVYYLRNTYTLTVYGDGGVDEAGNDVVTLTAKFGATIIPPSFTKKGYRFTGWSSLFPETMPGYNQSIEAQWEAVYVNYKVEHYHENALDDDYSLITTESFSELIDHEVEAVMKTYLGFSVNSEHPDSKHSGITLENDALVLKVYYKRNVYQITFKDTDGTPLDIPAISAKFDAPINAPTEPTKEGYVFLGWFVSLEATEAFEFTAMPLGGATLYAKYQVRLYKITFVSYAEIGVTEITAEYGTPINPPTDPIRQGYTFKGWYLDEETTIPYEFTVMPAEDITLYAKWEPNVVTVTFVYLDGSDNTVITGNVGDTLTEITPTKDGYTFDGWYTDIYFDNKFTEFIFPVSNITLYALWIPIDYTIEFVTGFEDVTLEPLIAPFESWLDLPIPVKEGYRFDGWYEDEARTLEFTSNLMPLGGITLYAKWVESAEESTIAYALEQGQGANVSIKGIVYAKVVNPYVGFYIKDAKNQIFCLADQETVNIGDEVMVTGYFERWNEAPMLVGISNVEVLSSDAPVTEPVELTFADLETLYPLDENFGKHVVLTGVLTNVEGQLYLVNPNNFKQVPIFHPSYDRFAIMFEVNNLHKGEFVLSQYDDSLGWTLALDDGDLELIPLTDEEKAAYIKTYLENLGIEPHYPLESFDLPTADLFGWSEIQATLQPESELFYDEETGVFADTEEAYDVLFDIVLTVGEYTDSFTLTVSVNPYPIISFYDFYQIAELGVYFFKATVIYNLDYMTILEDETGTLVLWDEGEGLEIGWEVIIKFDFWDYGYYSFELIRLLSSEKQPPAAVKVTETELLEREEDDNYLYQGQYVELRGIFSYEYDDYYGELNASLKVGNTRVFILDEFGMIDKTFPFNNMEVIIRGYLYYDYDCWVLTFVVNRGDFQIPDYTDIELVTALQQEIIARYQEHTFHSFTSMDLPKSHPILGGRITWKMASGYEDKYDLEKNCFVEVLQPTPIVIDISISYNEVNINFTINTVLYPEEVFSIEELPELNDGQLVTVKGLVVYKWFNWLYLRDETGIIRVTWYENTVQRGDYIRLTAQKDTRDYMAALYFEEDEHSFEIISTDNPVDIPLSPLTLLDLLQTEAYDINLISYYVEVTGELKMDSGDRLYFGEEFIYVSTPDSYTWTELKEYDGKIVTIKGYLDDFYYWDDTWYVMFTGMPGDIFESTLSADDKIAYVKALLEDRFEPWSASDSYFTLLTSYPQFDITISYEILKDEFNCYNIETGYLSPIEEDSLIEFEATITLGEIQEEVQLTLKVDSYGSTTDTPTVTISEFKNSHGETLKVVGKVMEIYSNYVLIEDETGMLFVRTTSFLYNYNYFINRKLVFTGQLNNHRGRLEMLYNRYESFEAATAPEVIFEPRTLAEIVSLDPYDDAVYGLPVEITGLLYSETDETSYNTEYYITDGFDRIRLKNFEYIPNTEIANYVGMEITVKGRIFGLDPYYYGNDVWTIQISRLPLVTQEYDEEAIVAKIKGMLIQNYDQATYQYIDYLYFDYNQYAYSMADVYFDIISGSEAIDFYSYSNSGNFYWVEEDVEIVFKVTINCGEEHDEFNLTIILKAMELNTYEDIFDETGGFKLLFLKGVLFHRAPDGLYFLIDDKVYFLANVPYAYDYYEEIEYLFTGYRATVDGKTNIWTNASVYQELGYFYEDYPEPQPITIQEIYARDFSEILTKIHSISGTLGHDADSGLYYLENLGERVYLRFLFPEARRSSEMGIRNGYLPSYLIGKEVMVRSLFPGKTIKGKYLFDVYGDPYQAIEEPEYTPSERVAAVVDYLNLEYHNVTFYSFESPWLPEYVDICSLIWEYLNPEDEQYFYYDNYGFYIKWLTEPVTVSYNVTITYEDYEMDPITTSIRVDIILKPREIITIEDLHRAKQNEYYTVKGIVQEVQQDNSGWIIIKDETGMFKIDTSGTYYDNLPFEVGDEVVAYGSYVYRSFQANPYFEYTSEIVILSRDNPVTIPPATTYTIEEIFALDYFDLSLVGTYITTTGTLKRVGSNYYLYVGSREIELLYATDILYQYVDSEVQISGYLMGLVSSQTSIPRWYLTVRDQITELN